MKQFVSISAVAEVNPKVPKYVSTALSEPATFLPMAAVSEFGTISSSEEASIGEVIKGYRYFEEGDTLLAKITPCMENGKAVLAEGIPHRIGFGSTEFHVIRPSSDIHKRYLFYMVWNPYFRYVAERNMTGTAGQRRVPTNFIKRFKIPLPPIDEQRRIAAILDKADAVRRKRKEAIALTEDLLRSAFLEMFGDPVTNPKGWKTVSLRSQVSELRYGTSEKCHDTEGNGALPVVRIPNVAKNEISWEQLRFANLESKEIEKLRLQTGDLLFVRSNGNPNYIGRCAVYLEEMPKAIYASYLIRGRPRPDAELLPSFIRDIISFPTYRSRLVRQARTTAGNYNINTRGLGQLKLVNPPKEEQEKYIQHQRLIEVRQKKQNDHLAESEALFNSLLRAFKGDL